MDYLKLLFFCSMIYCGTIFYTIAAYFHLSLKDNWSFQKAYMIAIPCVLIEYCFSLNGNYYMNSVLNFPPMNILIITICFYFINLWLLNYFILKHKGNIFKEIVCFGLIISAFLLTTVIR